MIFPSTFKLDWYGRILDVYLPVGKRNTKEYPEFYKDSEVYLNARQLSQRFPYNPLWMLLHRQNTLKHDVRKMNRLPPSTGKHKIKRDQTQSDRESIIGLLSEVLQPGVKGSRQGRYISIQQLRDILYLAIANWNKLKMPKSVYIDRCCASPSDADALYLSTKEWFSAWLNLLTSDLPAAEGEADALSYYRDWARQLVHRDHHPENSSAMLPERIIPYAGEDRVELQLAPVQSVAQQMALKPEDIIADPHTTLTLKTEVVVNHATSEEIHEIMERIQLLDDSGAKFSVGGMGTLVIEITVPTYCGYPISDGDHSLSLVTAARHIDTILRLVEVARNMQESQRHVEKLAEAYSGR